MKVKTTEIIIMYVVLRIIVDLYVTSLSLGTGQTDMVY